MNHAPTTASHLEEVLAGGVPLVGFSLMVAGYLILVGRSIAPPPPMLLIVVIVLAILFTGYQAVQRLRDLISGAALAEEDLLNRSYRSRSAQGRGTNFGVFERLGTGQRYRVVYSPVSKIVWALEPPEERNRW